MCASPFARDYFSVRADISFFCFLFVSEWDNSKTRGHLLARSNAQRHLLLFPHPSLLALSCRSLHLLIIFSSSSPRAKLREAASWMDGWMDSGRTDRKHLSPITTEENHIIWFAWHFSCGCLICPSHSSIHLVMMMGHLSHSRHRVRVCMHASTLTRYGSPAPQGYKQCN